MKKYAKAFALICTGTILLSVTACQKQTYESENTGYVDISNYSENSEEKYDTPLNVKIENYQKDTNPYSIMRSYYTINDNYLFMKDSKLDFRTGSVKSFCGIVGCAHDINSAGCMNQREICSPLCCSDGIYFVNGNKLFWTNGTEEKTILENDFTTDSLKKQYAEYYEENKRYPKDIYNIGSLVFSGDTLYIIGLNFYYTYDIATGKRSEPVDLCCSNIYGTAVADGNLYYCDDNQVFFYYNEDAGEVKKVSDKVTYVNTANGLVYFIQRIGDTATLYSADLDLENIKPVIVDCYVNCYIDDMGIYYQKDYTSNDKNVYRCNLDGSNPHKIDFFDGGNKFEINTLVNIISGDFIDNIFFIDLPYYIVAYNKNTGETVKISPDEHSNTNDG